MALGRVEQVRRYSTLVHGRTWDWMPAGWLECDWAWIDSHQCKYAALGELACSITAGYQRESYCQHRSACSDNTVQWGFSSRVWDLCGEM